MISSSSAITRGKLFFKYPWRGWICCIIFYLAPLGSGLSHLRRRPWETADLTFYLDNPIYQLIGLLLIIFPVIKIIIYQMYYDDWKKKTLQEVDDPECFINELARNHFYLDTKELSSINKDEASLPLR